MLYFMTPVYSSLPVSSMSNARSNLIVASVDWFPRKWINDLLDGLDVVPVTAVFGLSTQFREV